MESGERTMYKLSETEVLIQPSEYVDEKNFVGMYKYETTEGDGGYLDSFNALKEQIDFNYIQYKEQLKSLVRRQEDVRTDLKLAKRSMLIVLFFPAAVFLLLQVLIYFGTLGFPGSGLIALFGTVITIAVYPITIICEVFLLPGMVKNYANHLGQYRILTSDRTLEEYKKDNNYISFVDEKKYLKKKIMEYDTFYELVAVEGLDKKDGNLASDDSGFMTDDQKKVLDKMRSLSIFHEYKATVMATRKEVGIKWLIIGLGILMALAIVAGNAYTRIGQ